MNRYNFEPVLARLIRGTVRGDADQRDSMNETATNRFKSAVSAYIQQFNETTTNTVKSAVSSYVQQFIDVDGVWTSEQITRMLETEETQRMDAQIARFQKDVADNVPQPGSSRKKEIRKEKVREFAFKVLKPLLAARALRQLEHELGMVDGNGMMLRTPNASGSIGLQYLPYTPFNQDRLMAARKQRIRDEKRADAMAVKAFRDRVKAAQKGKSFYGHWEFENVEEEAVARTFMKNHERPVTAEDVFREQLAQAGTSVMLDVQLKWVEDGGNELGGRNRKRPNTKRADSEEVESTEEWKEGSVVAPEALHKKSRIVNLPIDFSRLNMKKRKQSPTSDATSTPKQKKQKMTASTAAEPDEHQLGEEIQRLTVQWMRQIYQDPAMSHPGFKGVHKSDSSGLSDPPDSDSMDIDD